MTKEELEEIKKLRELSKKYRGVVVPSIALSGTVRIGTAR